MNSRQREVLADKVPDMANIVTAALTFWGIALIFVLMIVEPK